HAPIKVPLVLGISLARLRQLVLTNMSKVVHDLKSVIAGDGHVSRLFLFQNFGLRVSDCRRKYVKTITQIVVLSEGTLVGSPSCFRSQNCRNQTDTPPTIQLR